MCNPITHIWNDMSVYDQFGQSNVPNPVWVRRDVSSASLNQLDYPDVVEAMALSLLLSGTAFFNICTYSLNNQEHSQGKVTLKLLLLNMLLHSVRLNPSKLGIFAKIFANPGLLAYFHELRHQLFQCRVCGHFLSRFLRSPDSLSLPVAHIRATHTNTFRHAFLNWWPTSSSVSARLQSLTLLLYEIFRGMSHRNRAMPHATTLLQQKSLG